MPLVPPPPTTIGGLASLTKGDIDDLTTREATKWLRVAGLKIPSSKPEMLKRLHDFFDKEDDSYILQIAEPQTQSKLRQLVKKGDIDDLTAREAIEWLRVAGLKIPTAKSEMLKRLHDFFDKKDDSYILQRTAPQTQPKLPRPTPVAMPVPPAMPVPLSMAMPLAMAMPIPLAMPFPLAMPLATQLQPAVAWMPLAMPLATQLQPAVPAVACMPRALPPPTTIGGVTSLTKGDIDDLTTREATEWIRVARLKIPSGKAEMLKRLHDFFDKKDDGYILQRTEPQTQSKLQQLVPQPQSTRPQTQSKRPQRQSKRQRTALQTDDKPMPRN
ncbi:expressed unknown protein [Seminavis robusta]|uniref:SAP domain-containing protein n=1 Tax=Seminavis robusta TaxID=568900 RepID=A0A9N8H1J0_9STRA|nr:expressed unknown protein [Seminavis robusta]|eukprot:Sro42_g025510.1 n/a (328) ;mRNA; r:37362-38345